MSNRQQQPKWRPLTETRQFDQLIRHSKSKPAMVLKYHPGSRESELVKNHLDTNWAIPSEELDVYLIDVNRNRDLANLITEVAGVDNNLPQVLLFADGVTMYDESHELISYKKIKIALKIINRTFRWMETRV